ncbi:MAG TPA: ABC transporter ATP-binding protein [Nocardioidaceae bacterium]|jgi:NitT/TauT family transport system ATP-binding protein
MPTMLEVRDLVHQYGTGPGAHLAVSGLTFSVDEDQLSCIVGPSGCGKSTLLRCIAGLIKPTDGSVTLHGDAVHGVPEDLAVVFQDYSRSLFPWLSVRGNVEFPLRTRVSGRGTRRTRAMEALEWVGLADAASKYPWQLSGGMQQRVSIARALASQPALLLMDEPFASVDAQTRAELEDLLLRVRREHGSTVLLVTHDIDESVYLGDRVLVLSRSPAKIVADLTVDLPAQRDQITTRGSSTFVDLRTEIARLLHDKQSGQTGPTNGTSHTSDEALAAERFLAAEREEASRQSTR